MPESNYIALGTCHCGKSFSIAVGSGRKRKHCSYDCRQIVRTPKVHVPAGERSFACAQCSQPFLASHKRKYCSTDCLVSAQINNIKAAGHAKVRQRRPVVCKGCNCAFCQLPGTAGLMAYCPPCAGKRTDNCYSTARKAKLKVVTVERVDRKVVFERDRWTCQICGIKTVSQPYTDRSAELDHIIPLALGGLHSYLNTQCACRKCNGHKGSKAQGQLLMFG